MSQPRYPAYQIVEEEWLLEVPATWPVERFSARTRTHRHSISPNQLEGQSVFHYSIPAIQETGTGLEEQGDSIDSNKLLVVEPQLLVSKLNPHKQVVLLVDQKPGLATVASTEFVPLVPTTAHDRYIFYVWQSLVCKHYLLARCDSATRSHQRVSPEDIVRMRWGWPTLVEQSAIATFLDRETAKIDALIAEQEKLLALLAEKRQATISHAVTRGLDPNVPMKDSGIPWLGEVPAHWEVSPLKYISSIGNGSTPNCDNPDYWSDSGFPWLNSSVVNQDEVTEAEQFVTELALQECHLPVIRPPAVLVGITGQGKTRGMAAPLMFEATINQHLAYVTPKPGQLEVAYLLRALEIAYSTLRTDSESTGSTKGAITCDQLSRFTIPLPPLDEQGAIAKHIDIKAAHFEKLASDSGQAIALLKERRSALIAAAVTGQIDVRGAVEVHAA